MPCNSDYGYSSSSHYERLYQEELKHNNWLEAALCASLTALENLMKQNGCAHPYDVIDYKEAGIKRVDLIKWHDAHKIKDAKRREREAEERKAKDEKAAKAKARKALIAKMSPEERELLGV